MFEDGVQIHRFDISHSIFLHDRGLDPALGPDLEHNPDLDHDPNNDPDLDHDHDLDWS